MKTAFKLSTILSSASALALLAGAPVQAQDVEEIDDVEAQDVDDADGSEEERIVVTGTLIRGISPEASNVISIDRPAIEATGAQSINFLLSTIPQLQFFGNPFENTVQAPFAEQETNNQVNIRSLGGRTSGGGATLIMMDGHRMPGAGVLRSTPDPDFIPTAALQGVEVVTDGGSALYGSDAVGGVVNFITRRTFDGVEVSSRYGFADEYETWDASIIAGTSWENGGAYVAYGYAENGKIFGRDRDYAAALDWTSGAPVPADNQCDPANILIPSSGNFYAGPLFDLGEPNRCDDTDDSTILSSMQRHNVFGSIAQDFGDRLKLDIRGFYGRRDTQGVESGSNTTLGRVSLSPGDAAYMPVGTGADAMASQTILFNWRPLLGEREALNELRTWGVTPTLTYDLGGDWQAQTIFNYGRGYVEFNNPLTETDFPGGLAGLANAGHLNPYDIASSTPTAVAEVSDRFDHGHATQTLLNARFVIDGPVVDLPGGEVRVAVGAEFIRDKYFGLQLSNNIATINSTPDISSSRNIKAGFAELAIPLVSEQNSFWGVHSFDLSLAGRWDDYSGFGDTFNPRIAVSYRPVEWILFRGSWGESFQAPTLADTNQVSKSANTAALATFPSVPPNHPELQAFLDNTAEWAAAGLTPQSIFIRGSSEDLLPQTADIWTAGVNVAPPFIEGLTLDVHWYKIDFRNILSLFIPNSQTPIPLYDTLVIITPTLEEATAATAGLPGADDVAALYSDFAPLTPRALFFVGNANIARSLDSGIDVSASYTRDTSFGSIFTRVSINYLLVDKVGDPLGDNTVDDFGSPHYRATASLGVTSGNLRAQATYRHTDGYDIDPDAANNFQTDVNPFNVVDLFFSYDVKGDHFMTQDLSLSFGIYNVLDEEPSENRGSLGAGGVRTNPGYTNGSTPGRLVQFGLTKKF